MSKYLYHLTDEQFVQQIMQTGLQPRIGPLSELAEETEPVVFLANKKSIPYWASILGKNTVLRITLSDEQFDTLRSYGYYYYSEYICDTAITPDRICKSRINTKLSDEKSIELALSYIDTISCVCTDFAKYVRYNNSDINWRASQLDKIDHTVKLLQFVLPRLPYDKITDTQLKTHLVEMGESGEYTLCDEYAAEQIDGRTLRLYELLGIQEYANENTKWLFAWLNKTFPHKLNISTGGWTG